MTTSTSNGHVKLVADEGKTFVSKDYNITNTVILGANDSIDNYTEITEEKAQKLEQILSIPDNPEINALLANILDMPNEQEESEEDA